MIKPNWPIDEIDYRLRERVGELVVSVSGQTGIRRGNEMRFGNKGGLKVDISGADKGRITPFDGAGKGMTPFQYIQSEMRCSFPEAVQWAAKWLGLSPDFKPDPETDRRRKEQRERDRQETDAREQAERSRRIDLAIKIYERSEDPAGTPAEIYLRARGITVRLPSDIRFLPAENGKFDALVVVARNVAGDICAVQRVFIHDGKKAPVVTVNRHCRRCIPTSLPRLSDGVFARPV